MTPIAGREDLDEGIRQIIARISARDLSTLGPDDDLVETLGVDSLQGLQILASVEGRFGLRLPDDELITLRTIRRIVNAANRVRNGG
jgi:acyl carrier protein